MGLINLFLASILTQNIVLTRFLGVCPFVGTSDKERNAVGMGLAVMLVVTISSIITYFIHYYVLVPTNTEHLRTVMFILIISSCVQIIEILIKKFFKDLYSALGIYLPLITSNCAVLGIVLLNINASYTFVEVLTFSIGSSLGFTLVIYIFSTIREKLEKNDIIKPLEGFPIALIIAGIMALLFSKYGA